MYLKIQATQDRISYLRKNVKNIKKILSTLFLSEIIHIFLSGIRSRGTAIFCLRRSRYFR